MSEAKKTKNSLARLGIFQKTEFTLGLIIIALFVLASVGTDNFCTFYNITNLMKQCAIIGVMAIAQTMIVITGGIAYGEDVVAKLKERCGWIAPVTVYPGEDELLALAQGALRVMNGEEQVKQY